MGHRVSEEGLNLLSEKIIGAAIEVSNTLGSGFLEKVYENALLVELRERGLNAESQVRIPVNYKSRVVGDYYADIVVEKQVIIELKCVEVITGIHSAQAMNYLRATGYRLALVMNFYKPKLEFRRVVNGLGQA